MNEGDVSQMAGTWPSHPCPLVRALPFRPLFPSFGAGRTHSTNSFMAQNM